MRRIVIIVVALLSFKQVASQTFNGNEKDIEIILKNTKDFSKYVMASNYKLIEASYTKDAKIFPNNSEILTGDDILKYWTLPEGVSISYHKIFQEEVTVTGDTAYDYGYYEGITKSEQGEQSWRGKYVIVWKKVDNDWKMYLDIWNSAGKK